ncbi:MAG: hypothetical protein GY858_09500 [Candidatus Omnitrophica bacterium]|nr:hypothetical protein [Candidatus Omnitrophota bacterium]
MSETPQERFKRIATKRSNRIIEQLEILANCSERKSYAFSVEQVEKMFGAIDAALQSAKNSFATTMFKKVEL